ncbi:hypothetical protein [Garicola koreensis]|uniref:Uncharacterized protein n=1 Tax=Garicola koreensis TaxID=1262554 RepID=A0A7W5TQ14_9MICC|nr:hypothetical protein [Garicola koreensis]MBB3667605.1 hypothetical protein [Garicola koreensis]
MMEFARACRTEREPKLTHPFTGERVACWFSCSMDDRYNLLGFWDGNDPFYVIQRVSFVDALYFPRRRLLLGFRHITYFMLEKLAERIEHEAAFPSTRRQFKGFVVSHHRPYHFFYEVGPALWEHVRQVSDKEGSAPAEIVQLHGGEYFPLERLVSNRTIYSTNSAYLNHVTGLLGTFYVKLGYSGYPESDLDGILERFDERVRGSLSSLPKSRREKNTTSLAFDISTARGTWATLDEDIPKVVNAVAEVRGGPVRVYLDGWTLSLTPNDLDLRHMNGELQLAQQMAAAMQDTVDVTVLVGASPVIKLEAFSALDAFVTRSGTGSMLVSRVLNKPGIVHGSGLSDYEEIHKQGDDVEFMFGDSSRHKAENESLRKISYDLDWKDVADRLIRLLPASAQR